jgi:hypothetical protein
MAATASSKLARMGAVGRRRGKGGLAWNFG